MQTNTNREIGSFFHKTEPNNILQTTLPFNSYQLFYTGRQAIKHLFDRLIEEKKAETIWLPEYYCQHVTDWLKNIYSNIKTYTINPFDFSSSIDISSFCSPEDIVLLNNFWGLSNYKIPTKNHRAIYIEDHSHGWLSKSCTSSKADYCVASLRKSLPIPLGGIYWKPNSETIIENNNHKIDKEFYSLWDANIKAMNLKSQYLSNKKTKIKKEEFISIIANTEEVLHNDHRIIKIKEEHKIHIESYLSCNVNSYKERNLEELLLHTSKSKNFKIIYSKSNPTFGLQLLFKNTTSFNNFKTHLIKHNVYPSHLWPGNKTNFDWSYLLNIHIDYRYNKTDMLYLAECINKWSSQNN